MINIIWLIFFILLQEKDEEIKKMQQMLQQMQAKLQAAGSNDTQVWL